MAPTFVDLFCGIGGFRIGLEAAGFECVYANDIDPTAVKVYKENRLPGATYPVECADIREVFHDRLDNIPHHHVLTAGFPCNSFTTLGKKEGEDDPDYGDLGSYVVKIAGAKRPVVVLLENVSAFFQSGKPWYENMKGAFKNSGYVCDYDIVTAWAVGLPQHRERGFIVAVREDVQILFNFPSTPKAKRVTLREFLLAPESVELESVAKVEFEKVEWKWKKIPVPEPARTDIVGKVPEGVVRFGGLRLLGAVKGPRTEYRTPVYHDLGHHPCVTSRTYKQWILTRDVDDESLVIRKLHLHELRRIQGFPDDFKLKRTTMKDAHRHLGNAVPPQMVEFIGRGLAEQYKQAFLDEDDRNAAKTPKRRRSRRKLSRKSNQKSEHKSRSSQKSSSSQSPSDSQKSSHKSSHKPTRKRRLSSGSDEAPPPKRQPPAVRYHTRSQTKSSTRTTGFDGKLKALARK